MSRNHTASALGQSSYVDLAGNHDRDPHRGARDENGAWGYKYDVTTLHRNPPILNLTALDCNNTDYHAKALARIRVNSESEKIGGECIKLLCAVYLMAESHSKVTALRETWAHQCDGFFVASTETDPLFDAIDIPHEGEEEYRNMWQKVRSIWSYIYDYYYEDFDWFPLGGDDMWVIVGNLHLYLESEEIRTAANGGIYLPDNDEEPEMQKPLYLGLRFAERGNPDDVYNTGGPGYSLNKATFKVFVVEGKKYLSHR